MRLSRFIRDNRETILKEWDTFARTLAPASQALNFDELRDHAEGILIAIEADLEQPQSKGQQEDKSKGREDVPAGEPTDAKAHGAVRAGTGFTLPQMVSEFRALRASVLRLWGEAMNTGSIEEVTRFNEAIDEALAQSILRFTDDLDLSQELFLGVLTHDLGDPLGAIMTQATQLLRQLETEGPQGKTASRILRGSVRMQEIIADLLDFIRTRMGTGIAITRVDTDLKNLMAGVVAKVTAAVPEAVVKVELKGKLDGCWDLVRLTQALSNLIQDLVVRGGPASPVAFHAHGEPGSVAVSINGKGPTIPREDLGQIFAPLHAGKPVQSSSQLGLGLYLAQEIVFAHGGVLTVDSTDEEGTTFALRVPRAPAVQARN